MPVIMPGNMLIMGILNDCHFSRDINGVLDYNVLLEVMKLYEDIIGLDSFDKLYLIKKVNRIMSVELEHKEFEREQKTLNTPTKKNPKTIGGR